MICLADVCQHESYRFPVFLFFPGIFSRSLSRVSGVRRSRDRFDRTRGLKRREEGVTKAWHCKCMIKGQWRCKIAKALSLCMKAVNLAPNITFEKTSKLEIKKETSRAKEGDLKLYNNRTV